MKLPAKRSRTAPASHTPTSRLKGAQGSKSINQPKAQANTANVTPRAITLRRSPSYVLSPEPQKVSSAGLTLLPRVEDCSPHEGDDHGDENNADDEKEKVRPPWPPVGCVGFHNCVVVHTAAR